MALPRRKANKNATNYVVGGDKLEKLGWEANVAQLGLPLEDGLGAFPDTQPLMERDGEVELYLPALNGTPIELGLLW